MTQTNENPTPPRPNPTSRLAESQQMVNQAAESISALRTETDRASSLLGFGRRIWVPADEVHVAVGHGFHIARSAAKGEVFGQSAERPSQYWLNPRSKVIKLKTISFTVPLLGPNNDGIEALDTNKVSFRIWAHAVAQLDPHKAEVAARRIGQDTEGLLRTISQVAMSELIEAAAQMELSQIIANRQSLAREAFPKVNRALAELGYDLSVLTVTRLAGDAYTKLVTQAESRVSKETTIAINREQLAEQEDLELRSQREGQIEAETKQKLAATEAITTEKLVATERAKQKALLEKVSLDKELNEAEVEKQASLQKRQAEYAAEIRALEQRKDNALALEKSEAEAQRFALEQARKIERDAELTSAEAGRLRQQELEKAERVKEIALVQERQTAESIRMQAEAEAKALEIQTTAETRAELARAEAQARATEQTAIAAKTRAEATRAEAAAAGLAEVEVEEARVVVAEQKVAVQRAEGLAKAEIALAQGRAEVERAQKLREIEINAEKALRELDITSQQKMAKLYEEAPVLIELEKVRMQLTHEEKMAQIRAETALRGLEALAPGIKMNLFGQGGQMGEMLNNVFALAHGVNMLGEQVPVVGRWLETSESPNAPAGMSLPLLGELRPHLQTVLQEVNPRILSTLKVGDVVERLQAVVSGQENLATALTNLKNESSFRVIGDLPVQPFISWLGLGGGKDAAVVEQVEVVG